MLTVPCTELAIVLAIKNIRVEQRQLEMWTNAQRDGRRAEHRLRPLFDAAKFG